MSPGSSPTPAVTLTRVTWSDTTGAVHSATTSDRTTLLAVLDHVLGDRDLCVIAISTTPTDDGAATARPQGGGAG